MKVVKKYTAIQIISENHDSIVRVKLLYGEINGPYYSREHPQEEFDTEQEAIEWAYKENKYGRWLITPIIRFE